MADCVLVTGGAGFIGAHLTPRLARAGYRIVVLDNLHPQVHGPDAAAPALPEGATFVKADIRDREAVAQAVREVRPDHVIHLAAETGTGQSWDEVHRYCDVNVGGTAALVEALRALPPAGRPRRVVLASSRAVYGEGAYRDEAGRLTVPPARRPEDMRRGLFDPVVGGVALQAVPTPESTPPAPASIYASTKLMQEYVLTQALLGTDAEPVILRFQNVYGPGQSLRNPYTGVLSIFSGQILAGQSLNIYEDGKITRDFVYVGDVVDAVVLALTAPRRVEGVVNIGSGEATTIHDAARELVRLLGVPGVGIAVSGQFRAGDVRHAVADIGAAAATLGWTPRTGLTEGLGRLVAWVRDPQGTPAV
ncbi:SDR family NAD(P)-dependent oxidoreductase [uncultured Methylobacterium sp.]|jgi:dTDP-L-rhamnose 4-epimerase|uniref:SDR family NAD(P)-dependent oxidoreductase n=1 Tax=uncultured Methylobacterium sp. TaxID=157278 RepID=UPI0026215A5B|nr:SDR family NAD(P)-dependent oxidoreductase [uncultured Methylobacterium sp.]